MGKCENFNFSKLAQNKFPVCPDCRKNIHLSDSGIDIYFENKKLNEFYNVKIEAKKFIKIYGENQKSCDYILIELATEKFIYIEIKKTLNQNNYNEAVKQISNTIEKSNSYSSVKISKIRKCIVYKYDKLTTLSQINIKQKENDFTPDRLGISKIRANSAKKLYSINIIL